MPLLLDPTTDISEELDDNEKLLWAGRPRQGIFFRPSDVFLIPFSLMWGGFAIFWEVSVLFATFGPQSNTPDFVRFIFPLWGLPFVAVGLYLIFGRFFVERAQRAKTTYGITDSRVIIHSGLFSRTTKSLNLRTLSDVSLAERSDGSGTIILGPTAGFYSWFYGTSWPGMGVISHPVSIAYRTRKQFMIFYVAHSQRPDQAAQRTPKAFGVADLESR